MATFNQYPKVKFLEKLKTGESYTKALYENGKYILFFKKEMVCLKGGCLAFNGYEDIMKLDQCVVSKTVLLDIITNSSPYTCLFAINLKILTDETVQEIESKINGKFLNVWQSLFYLNAVESQYVTHALGLLNFCQSCKYCSNCGGELTIKEGGHQKYCEKCKQTHYPILSPICVTLIEDESHKEVLLVRQSRHPPGMFTCVAGFIEPGESLEESVKREVAEEVGLEIMKVEYCTSQHWALSASQLTLGCIATAKNKNIIMDGNELKDAKWVPAEDLIDAVIRTRNLTNIEQIKAEKLWAPPKNAVSHNLMATWLKKNHNFDC